MNTEALLVGIINNIEDFKIMRDQRWYRIPTNQVEKSLKNKWPPKWIAFYFSGAIKNTPFMIYHYAKVKSIIKVSRKELFPLEINSPKSSRMYYQINFDTLETLRKPILSRRWRRIIFIESTFNKFINAVEINDLFDGSELEDRLWAEFKRNNIGAERQELVQVNNKFYFLDFALYCSKGKLNIETDGDFWHHNPQSAVMDNIRNNDLSTYGWNIIRFTSSQIMEQMQSYCIPQVKNNINSFGGILIDEYFSKRFEDYREDGNYQYNFFDYYPED